jgi:hypothetical protein
VRRTSATPNIAIETGAAFERPLLRQPQNGAGERDPIASRGAKLCRTKRNGSILLRHAVALTYLRAEARQPIGLRFGPLRRCGLHRRRGSH